MSSESPAAVLFDGYGNALAVQNATPVPVSTPAILFAGTDGINSLYQLMDGYGRQIIVGASPAGSIPVGSPIYVGASVTAVAPTYADGTINVFSLTTSGLLRIDGSAVTQPVSGTVVTNQGIPNSLTNGWPIVLADGYGNLFGTSGNPITIDGYVNVMGSITAINSSVSASNTAPPPDATYIGGSVTTAAPTYTDSTMNALSLTTTGALRVDASGTVQPVSGVVTSNQGVANTLANAWPVELADGYGNLFGTSTNPVNVIGTIVTNKASTSIVTSVPSNVVNTVILAANPNRILASIFNSANKPMFVKMGSAASLISFSIQLMPGSYWEPPQDYVGEIDALWSTGVNGSPALVTEMTP